MSDAANECIPYYEPGTRITGNAKEAVTGKRFVKIAAKTQSGPELSSTAEGSNIQIEHASAGAQAFGVSSHDAAKNEKVTILRGGAMVVPVFASVAMSAGEEVGVGADGKAVKAVKSSEAEIKEGKGDYKVEAVGLLLDDVAEGGDAMVALYR
jgi:Uncharacterized conserved protein (DUF2190)